MMVRFSPRSEFQKLAPARNVSPALPAAGPILKRGKFTQALVDIATLLFGALFFAALLGSVAWSVLLLSRAL